MRVRLRHLALYFAAVVLAMCASPSFASNTSRMEQAIQPFVRTGQFMGAVLVSENGKALLDRGYGYANLEWRIPDRPDTKFRLGSITKQFTAASILLLQERGKLKLDDPVKNYVPDAPAAWDRITIYNLLTHTSGIPELTDIPGFLAQIANPATPEQQIKWFLTKPLDFPPGTKWSYSNSGYMLLGYIIQKVSGKSYQQFLRDNIFEPLGMHDSGYDSNQTIIQDRASGYSFRCRSSTPASTAKLPYDRFFGCPPDPAEHDELAGTMPDHPYGRVNASYVDMSQPFSAGGLYSTTHDLLKWEEGLFGRKVLSPASLKEMTTPFLNHYGCGVRVEPVEGHTDVHHSGATPGFDAEMDYMPDEQVIVIVLANLNGPAAQEIARRLVEVAVRN